MRTKEATVVDSAKCRNIRSLLLIWSVNMMFVTNTMKRNLAPDLGQIVLELNSDNNSPQSLVDEESIKCHSWVSWVLHWTSGTDT